MTLANVTFYSIFDVEAKCFGINNFTFYRHRLRHTIQIIPRIIGPHVLFSGHTALEIHWSYVHSCIHQRFRLLQWFSICRSQECMGWVNCRDVGFWHAKWLDTRMESYTWPHCGFVLSTIQTLIVHAIVSTHPDFCMWWYYIYYIILNYIILYK